MSHTYYCYTPYEIKYMDSTPYEYPFYKPHNYCNDNPYLCYKPYTVKAEPTNFSSLSNSNLFPSNKICKPYVKYPKYNLNDHKSTYIKKDSTIHTSPYRAHWS